MDKQTLLSGGNTLTVLRQAPSFVEAVVARGSDRTAIQWARGSAFRFFPLIDDERFGLVLHPFDLATNKVLAMAGRLEVRDWIDVLTCDDKMQPFGYLVWAACGKDPGYNPQSLLAIARRQRYSRAEVATLDFAERALDAARLGLRWHQILEEADQIVTTLPPDQSAGYGPRSRIGVDARRSGTAMRVRCRRGAAGCRRVRRPERERSPAGTDPADRREAGARPTARA